MMKTLLFLNLVICPSIFTMAGKDKYTVSIECKENIDKISRDGGTLCYYLQNTFQAMGYANQPAMTPSKVLNIARERFNMDESVKLEFMLATQYLSEILSPFYEKLDATFKTKLEETKSIPDTWNWFAENFKENGINEAFTAYKLQLIEQDAEQLKQQEQGAFILDHIKTVDLNIAN